MREQYRKRNRIVPAKVTASSVDEPQIVPYKLDKRCQRTEYFVPEFAVDGSNGSRWMATETDTTDSWGVCVMLKQAVWLLYALQPDTLTGLKGLLMVKIGGCVADMRR